MNRNLIIASVIGVVFLFAGYNLYSYFKDQQAIQAAEDLRAEQRRVEREVERARVSAEIEAKRLETEQAREQARIAEEARKAEEAELRQQARLKAEADAELRSVEKEKKAAADRTARLDERTTKARTISHVPEIYPDVLLDLSKWSPRYVQDHPGEFLGVTIERQRLSPMRDRQFMVYDGMDSMMLFSIIDQDTKMLEALLGIGMDVNAANEGGFTPLMFAAAYAYPSTVRYLLEQGADLNAKAYVMDLNALHIAALKNPDPNMIDVLLDAGLTVESPVQNGFTPLLLAAMDNRNLEVVERLIDRGADIGVYDDKGKTVKSFVQDRINGSGDIYVKISDEMNARILVKLE
ncbi:ankyrin repeat domain-containing protein [Sulfitobacter sp.]|uniref:ankyrin repeat domain-containing protein n=1 Tax=Sulfitobacter sp. TaxID=1903071 RepID=UPI003567C1B0